MTTLPLTLLAAQKTSDLLTLNSSLAQELASLASSAGTSIPTIDSSHVILSSATNDVGDTDTRLGYPRVCLYTSGFINSQIEKFCSLSGVLSTIADVWTSANMVDDTDRLIHYYVDAVTRLLRNSAGDWGNGLFFPGVYDVQIQPPKTGGLGFVQVAKIRFDLIVSQE